MELLSYQLSILYYKLNIGETMKKIFLIGLKISIALGASYGALDQMGVFDGRFNGQQLLYYTILSNVVIAVAYCTLFTRMILKNTKKKQRINVEFKANVMGALTMMILATGIIYHAILVPNLADLSQYGEHAFSNFLVHTYVPVAVGIDWLFIKLSNKEMNPINWLIIPLSYWGLAVFYASFNIPLFKTGSNYAYFFIDVNKLGWSKVLLNVLLLSIFFLFLGYCVKGIKILEGYTQRNNNLKSKK